MPELSEGLQQPEPKGEPYQLSEDVAAPLVFSTSYKRKLRNESGWMNTALLVLGPAIVGAMAMALSVHGLSTGGTLLAGTILITVSLALASELLAVRGYGELEERLRKKLDEETLPFDASDATFVGFTPTSRPRISEGFYDWDVGLMSATRTGLAYVGEKARFLIAKESITGVELGPGAVSWWRPKRVYLSWQAAGTSEVRTVSVSPAGARTRAGLSRRAKRLFEEFRHWRDSEEEAVDRRPV